MFLGVLVSPKINNIGFGAEHQEIIEFGASPLDIIKSGSGFDKLKELATFSNNFNESA